MCPRRCCFCPAPVCGSLLIFLPALVSVLYAESALRSNVAASAAAAVDHRIELRIVIHLHLPINLEPSLAPQHGAPKKAERLDQIGALFFKYRQPLEVPGSVSVRRLSPLRLLPCMKDLQGQDGHPVDHHARCLGVKNGVRLSYWQTPKKSRVDLLDEVVPLLIMQIDGSLDRHDLSVRSGGIASLVFLMPQIKVGPVIAKDESDHALDCIRGRFDLVPSRRPLILQLGYGFGFNHYVHPLQDSTSNRRSGGCWLRLRQRPSRLKGDMAKVIRRVLLYRLGSLGDTVVALPALHLVARAFPSADRRLLTNFPVNVKAPPAAAILKHTDLVQGFFRYAVGTRSPREILRLWWQLLQWRPQVLVYLGAPRGVESAKRDALFFRLCGIHRQIGVPLTEDMQRNLPTGPEATLEPEASRLARNIAELGPANLNDASSWDLHLTETEHARAQEALISAKGRPLVAVSVGTKVQAKDWGAENWRALLGRLAAGYPGHALALAGAPEESLASDIAAADWTQISGCPVINLCGKLTPRESAAAFARARIFIGHDSGPMHLAAAVQTPCVAIFAARNLPRVWFPYGPKHRVLYHHVECAGCELETCTVQRKKCLTSITMEEVLAEVHGILEREPQPSPTRDSGVR